MGVIIQDDYNLGAEDLLSSSKATPFLHGHLKLNEGGGDILSDSSGNGRNLTWNTTGANATSAAAGVWTDNGLEYGIGTVGGDSFNAASKADYNIGDTSQTWVCVVQFILTANPTGNISLFSGRGAAGGAVDAGHTFTSIVTPQVSSSIHNGTTTLAFVNSGAGNIGAVDERYTAAICVDAAQSTHGSLKLILAGDETNIQYEERAFEETSALNDTSTSNDYTCIGQRSSAFAGDITKSVIFKNVRCYCDPDGGALPENLPDIVRWLHQNPEANIPAKWWS